MLLLRYGTQAFLYSFLKKKSSLMAMFLFIKSFLTSSPEFL